MNVSATVGMSVTVGGNVRKRGGNVHDSGEMKYSLKFKTRDCHSQLCMITFKDTWSNMPKAHEDLNK